MDINERPGVGAGVLIIKDGKTLLAKRKSVSGFGEYCFPGGKLDYGESLEDCVIRETREEAGIEIKNIKFICVGDEFNYPPKHFVFVGFTAEWESGEPKNMEPDKFENWNWYDLNSLPEPIFAMSNVLVEAYRSGKTYFKQKNENPVVDF